MEISKKFFGSYRMFPNVTFLEKNRNTPKKSYRFAANYGGI